jgi:hypothetical protein
LDQDLSEATRKAASLGVGFGGIVKVQSTTRWALTSALFATATLGAVSSVNAQSSGAAQPAASVETVHPRRVFALTFSPLHLTLPALEVTGEARLHDKVGVALIAGGGKVDGGATINGTKTSVTMVEIGAQGRYYVVGDFRHGVQLGAEGIYIHGSAARDSVSAVASGLTIGPFVGYKFTADVGFTFDGQIGYQRIGIGGSASDGTTSSTAKNHVLLNLNVGWSF